MPCSRLRYMFSIITIASSTTKPTEIASAISDKLSIEKPANHIPAQVPARVGVAPLGDLDQHGRLLVEPCDRAGVANRILTSATSDSRTKLPFELLIRM